MIYYKHNADIQDIYPNVGNRKFGFVVRCKDDDKDYFVKPSWSGHFHNENEYIAHHIASLMGAPVPKGRFLHISTKNIEIWHKYVQSLPDFNTIFMPPYKSAVFFGVEILKAIHVDSVYKLKTQLNSVKNYKQFFAQYPLDQYLKNPDRHLGNYFFHQENSKHLFCLIDFDRLFYAATDWSKLDNVNDFNCFTDIGYNADLYKLVDNKSSLYMKHFTANIEKIKNEEIEDIIETMISVYPRTQPFKDKIRHWIKHRRDSIYEQCLANEKCYSGITKKGLFSVSR